jgi:hypothetical protein
MSFVRVTELLNAASKSTITATTDSCIYAWNMLEAAWECVAPEATASPTFAEKSSYSWNDYATYALITAGLLAAATLRYAYIKSRPAPPHAALVPLPAPAALAPAKKKVAPEKTFAERFEAVGYDDEKIPNIFLCSIMQTPMTDPVVAVDGHLYEREVIEQYLTAKEKQMAYKGDKHIAIVSPMDNKTEIDRSLIPVNAIKSDISTLIEGLERPYYGYVRTLFAASINSEKENAKENKVYTSEKQLSDIVNLIKKY